jgi:hypothetical protein
MWDLERSTAPSGVNVFTQTANLAALQMFIGDHLYLKAGFGLAMISQDDGQNYWTYDTWGVGFMGGLGVELVQGYHYSLALEASLTGARYNFQGADETWLNWALPSFILTFF